MSESVLAASRAEAAVAAARADVTVRDVIDVPDVERVCELFDLVWGGSSAILPSNLGRALAHSGNFLAAAIRDDQVVGAAFGFLATGGGLHLHSHLLAVHPDLRTSGVGVALKQHQRSWALERGLSFARWTYDPLVARNGFINLCKLGTHIVEYHVNFYGNMPDAINDQDESDRLVVQWDLANPRTIEMTQQDVDALRAAGGALLDETEDGAPLVSQSAGPVVLCKVPTDIVELRKRDPDRANAWRHELRNTMGRLIAEGYTVTGLSRSGWYRLQA